ncbi:M23 family metallopeptidase [Ilumatobacter coccineus]|uniref:Putative metalloendopeptidase n=1 Tax=Ilumatobacter coccineus (strain NBRC 103263 / KCTC 29153 / YM16-304) TaxID=1313172 RepID=A0A6C7EGH6_ILUCY|nr:M23 family metallopeptidase [Ilumatobacter coccineus]BAN04085.1 putative metalloendopeptidase [Ilumatobacter coccineus YM16-304]
MSHQIHDPNCACMAADDEPARPAGRLSRRSLFSAAAVGAGALALSRLGSVSALGPAGLDEPGAALLPAQRLTPPTTLPNTYPFEPPAVDEILFPIVVGEGDTCGVLNNFGDTRGRPYPYYHQACDIMADEGLPLRAVVDGELTKRYEGGFYGWTLYDEVTDIVYKYFHNTPDANGFVVGDRVKQGDIIGFVGDTGTSPGNFHLHFEYRPGNIPADPYDLFQRAEHVQFW